MKKRFNVEEFRTVRRPNLVRVPQYCAHCFAEIDAQDRACPDCGCAVR